MKYACTAFLLVLLPSMAAAQTSGIYVQGGAVADLLFRPAADPYPADLPIRSTTSSTFAWNDLNGDRRWQPGEEGPAVSSSLLPSLLPIGDAVTTSKTRVAPGATAAIGVFITPSISLRLEGSFQGEQLTTTEVGDLGSLISITDRQATAVSDIFVAAAWHHGGTRRTTLNYLAGMVFRRQHEEFSLAYRYSPRLLPPQIGLGLGQTFGAPTSFEDRFDATSYSAGIMAGLDVPVRLTQRFAAVPHVRLVAANHTLSVRPGIAVRWQR